MQITPNPAYPTPIATVDAVLLTLRNDALCVGLLRREQAPYEGVLALPGGWVHVQEDRDLEAAARRILHEKVATSCRFLEQLATFSGLKRDPRGWSLSVVYFALIPDQDLVEAGSMLTILPVDGLPKLAFDHADIVNIAVERLRGKSSYFALPAYLLPPVFTMAELHRVYEQVLGARLDRASFRRKVEEQCIVEHVEGDQRVGAHRPAALYRLHGGRPHSFQRRI
jgi:8-oxo-dGTP diphosphatase